MEPNTERLQAVLSHRGVASRRHSARIISQCRVSVNGQTVSEPGYRVSPDKDLITVDGIQLAAEPESPRTVMLNKPQGYVTTMARDQGCSVMQFVATVKERIVPVGRLDKDSEGLLLLSNDGDLVNRLTHPRHGHTKCYVVEVRGVVSKHKLTTLRQPIEIDGAETRPAAVSLLTSGDQTTMLEFVISEGRNRQIRRLCQRAGLEVLRLKRVAIGRLILEDLPHGKWRDLTQAEIAAALA